MALNMDAIGQKIGPLKKDYDWKDVILYALGVGAGVDDLDYTYEKNLKVIPTFSIAAIFEFLGHVGVASNVNLAGVLHGEQELIFHNPIPTSGTLITEGAVTHYYDKGAKGALVVAESETVHSNGEEALHEHPHDLRPPRRQLRRPRRPPEGGRVPGARGGLFRGRRPLPEPAPPLSPFGRSLPAPRRPRICQDGRVRKADHARPVHPRLCLPSPDGKA